MRMSEQEFATEEEFYHFLNTMFTTDKEFKHNFKLMISADHSKYELLEILMTLLNEYVDLTGEKGLIKLTEQYPKLLFLAGRTITMQILEAEEREEKEG